MNSAELSMGGVYNLTTSSDANPMATMDKSTIPTSTLITNSIVKNAELSTGGGFNPTVSQNTNIMSTY